MRSMDLITPSTHPSGEAPASPEQGATAPKPTALELPGQEDHNLPSTLMPSGPEGRLLASLDPFELGVLEDGGK